MIIGGGLAGLAAANELRLLKIPFLLLEASSRWGGRVLTLEDFNSGGQVAELGGEWIYPHQKTILALATEMHLDVQMRKWEVSDFDVGPRPAHSLWQKQKPVWTSQNARIVKVLANILPGQNLTLNQIREKNKNGSGLLSPSEEGDGDRSGLGFDSIPMSDWTRFLQTPTSVFWPGTGWRTVWPMALRP